MKKFLLVFVLVLFLITFASAGLFKKETRDLCGDGTIEGNCSSRQPYFCSEQLLTEKASICGCTENMTQEGDSCISEYERGVSKEITLKYILRGEEGEIDYIVYENMVDYLSTLSPFITYRGDEGASRIDFKLRSLNEPKQRELLLPLVTKIQNLADNKEDQMRIAISLTQHISFGSSNKTITVGNNSVNYSRYPYEVLYEQEGICASKSELLVFLLREIGYETVFFYHELENHDSVGIKCPEKYGLGNTSYCFVETTGPAVLTDNENAYLEGVKLISPPEIMNVSTGDSLGYMYEYRDAKILKRIRQRIEETGKINLLRQFKLNQIRKKYGIA